MKKIIYILLLFSLYSHGQIVDRFTRFGAVDAWLAAGPIGYFTPSSLDAAVTTETDPLNTWVDDGSVGSDLTATTTTRPTLNVNASGVRQARFDGDDFFVAGNSTDFQFTPQSSNWTIVIKLGESVTPGAFDYMVSKAGVTGSTRTYSVHFDNGGIKCYAGGTHTAVMGTATGAENDLIIVTFAASSTGLNVYQNGTQVGTNLAIGTGNDTSAPFTIGGRTGTGAFNGDIEKVAIYDKILSAGEMDAIEAQEGFFVWWIALLIFANRNYTNRLFQYKNAA